MSYWVGVPLGAVFGLIVGVFYVIGRNLSGARKKNREILQGLEDALHKLSDLDKGLHKLEIVMLKTALRQAMLAIKQGSPVTEESMLWQYWVKLVGDPQVPTWEVESEEGEG